MKTEHFGSRDGDSLIIVGRHIDLEDRLLHLGCSNIDVSLADEADLVVRSRTNLPRNVEDKLRRDFNAGDTPALGQERSACDE